MRLLHTADWHLGKIVNDFSMIEDQRYLLNKLIEQVKTLSVDAVVMAGDLYDRSLPPKEAVALADEILTRIVKELGVPVLAISGNHDSSERLEYGSRLFTQNNLHIEGTLKEKTRRVTIGDANFYLVPFADPAFVREKMQQPEIRTMEDVARYQIEAIKAEWNPAEINVLVAHGYVINGNVESVETSASERPLSIGTAEYVPVGLLEGFDYVALGHLHKPQKVKEDHIRYSGSLLKYSKSEADHRKQATLVDLEKGKVSLTPLHMEPLRDMKILRGTFAELLGQRSNDYVFFELLDQEIVFDPMNQLRKKFPNAMGLEYCNRQANAVSSIALTQADLKAKKLPDLFTDFYEDATNTTLSPEARKFISQEFQLAERSTHETH
ncbi:exonuclease SbcCD subunit D [Jeotgalibaca sp. A127]|uniref:exonuclease SbcCD subunit D n=1 Tax=Jeotgalibaca sp. A127 TaxID=3457324 RepID=UPI003FD33A07